VLTKAHPKCGSEQKISWNQTGPAGGGYHFTTMSGRYNRFGEEEADGPTILRAGTYFVDVNADVRITAAGPIEGECALDVTISAESLDFKIFSPLVWTLAFPPDDDVYPASVSGLVTITSGDIKHPLTYGCDSAGTPFRVDSSRWWISPVSASTASTASVSTATPRR
jgi:hypothetical protein